MVPALVPEVHTAAAACRVNHGARNPGECARERRQSTRIATPRRSVSQALPRLSAVRSYGMFTHEGPSEQQMAETTFSFTNIAKGYSQGERGTRRRPRATNCGRAVPRRCPPPLPVPTLSDHHHRTKHTHPRTAASQPAAPLPHAQRRRRAAVPWGGARRRDNHPRLRTRARLHCLLHLCRAGKRHQGRGRRGHLKGAKLLRHGGPRCASTVPAGSLVVTQAPPPPPPSLTRLPLQAALTLLEERDKLPLPGVHTPARCPGQGADSHWRRAVLPQARGCVASTCKCRQLHAGAGCREDARRTPQGLRISRRAQRAPACLPLLQLAARHFVRRAPAGPWHQV